MGYATKSKAYRIFNKRSLKIEESINVSFDETNVILPPYVVNRDDDDIVGGLDNLHINKPSVSETQLEQEEGTNEVDNEIPRA